MPTIKPIIGVVSYLGFYEKNIAIFSSMNCIVVDIKSIDDIHKVDAIVFPSFVSSAMKIYLGAEFIDYVFEKIISDHLAVWFIWESIKLFEDKFELKKIWNIDDADEEISLNFLDLKPLPVKILNANIYSEEKHYKTLFKWNFEHIWYLGSWESCILRKDKILITTFSPEYYSDIRMYEYFLNDVI